SHRQKIAPLELNGAAGDHCFGGQKTKHGARDHRLACTGFPDQAPYLPGFDLEAHSAQNVGHAGRAFDPHMQTVDLEHGGHRRCTGSSVVRKPSPSKLKPITAKMTLRIEKNMIHGD